MTDGVYPDVIATMTNAARRDWFRRREETIERRAFVVELHDWLATFPWAWFGHLTLRSCESLRFMHKLVEHWRLDVNRRLFGRNYWKCKCTGLSVFYVCERHDRGDFHAHVLVADARGADPSVGAVIWNLGTRRSGAPIRTAQVDVYGGGGSIGYCTNFLDGKDPDVTWGLAGPRFH